MSSTAHATLISNDRGWRRTRWLALGHFRWRSELTMHNQARLRKRRACRRALAWHGERRRAQYGNPVSNSGTSRPTASSQEPFRDDETWEVLAGTLLDRRRAARPNPDAGCHRPGGDRLRLVVHFGDGAQRKQVLGLRDDRAFHFSIGRRFGNRHD
jgi:hypothetical protein